MDFFNLPPEVTFYASQEQRLLIHEQNAQRLESEDQLLLATYSRNQINAIISETYAAIETLQKVINLRPEELFLFDQDKLEKRKADLSYLQRENTKRLNEILTLNSN